MRQLVITIYRRPGVTRDFLYNFNSEDEFLQSQIYQFINLNLNYSVLTSQITSTLVLGMNEPINESNVIRSGQPVQITDNGQIVFQGLVLSPRYTLLPMTENSQGGSYLIATLAPSIYQLTLTPVIFDQIQVQQIQAITGVDVGAILVGDVTQLVETDDLLDYMISNTDYSNFFQKGISAQDLGDNLFLMASVDQMRDPVLRQSIDYYNCVLYQQEDGTIVIRQLDSALEAPFDIDLANQFVGNGYIPNTAIDTIPIVPLLSYEYVDNAYSTPAVVSNYCMIDAATSVSSNAQQCVLTYAPNSKFFPRIKELELGGWFTGQVGITQLNDNIINDPTTAAAIKGFQQNPDQYMVASQASGVKEQGLAAYQALLTAKQMALGLAGYATINATISLDDPNLPADLGSVIGTVIQVQSCDLSAGLIATLSRSYSADGSYMNFNIVPLGSYTGYWTNSTFNPEFDG